ncbi:MAG: GAF domain-containing protein [Anaerolineales bacterium]|nr:GAF domain-containing protein [Anaerolineales bacterium]
MRSKGSEQRKPNPRPGPALQPDLVNQIMQVSPVAMAVVDAEGRIVSANQLAEKVLGLKKSEITSCHYDAPAWRITDYDGNPFPEEDLPFNQVRRTGQLVQRVHHTIEHPDGRRVYLSINAAPLFDADGQLNGMVASLADVTERREAEQELQRAQQRLRAIVDAAPFGAHEYELHADGRLVFIGANRSADRILGVAHKQFIGKTIEEAFPALAETHVPEAYRRVASTGEPFHDEQVGYQDEKIGGAFDVTAAQTGTNRMAAFFQDVTERRKGEAALRDSQQMLRLILDTIPVRVFWKDRDLNFLGANRPFALDAGLESPEDLIGKNDYQMIWAEQADLYRADDRQVIESGEAKVNYEEPQASPSGDIIWLRTSKAPLRDSSGEIRGVLGTYEDITESMHVAEQLQRQIKELRILQAVALASAQATDEDALIEDVTQIIADTLDLEDFGVMLLDAEGKSLQPHRSYRNAAIAGTSWHIPMPEGISGRVVVSGKPVRVADVGEDRDYVTILPGSRSELCVPIKLKDRVIGVINTENPAPDFYNPEDERLLTTIAGQLGIGIEKIRLLEAERLRRQEAETLRQAIAVVSSSLDLQKVLGAILDSLRQVVPYDRASVFLQEGEHLCIRIARGFEELHGLPEQTFPVGEKIFQRICRTKQVLVIGDVQKDRRFKKWETIESTHGWMGVPLIVRDEVIGYITLDNQKANAYSADDAAQAQIFAYQAAVALENARLYEQALRATDRRVILHQASQEIALASQDPELVYAAVHRATARLMPAEAFAIAFLDESANEIEAVYLVDKAGRWPARRLAPDEGLSGRVISTGQSIKIDDRAQQSEPLGVRFGEEEDVRSIMAVPLRRGGETIGMISAQSYAPNVYDLEDQALLEMLANHAAVAMENARLYAETLRSLRDLEAINRISNALRASEDLEQMLPGFLDETLALLGSGSGTIELYDPETRELRQEVSRGWFSQINGAPLKEGEGIAGTVFQTGAPIVSREYITDSHIREEVVDQVPPGWGGVCVPIRATQAILGVLFVSVHLPRQISEEEVTLLNTLADIAGNAIRRAMLYEQTERQLQRMAALRAIDMAISSILDVRVTLGILLDHIIAQLKVDAVDVLLLNPRSQMLVYAAGSGFYTDAIQDSLLHRNDGLPGQVLQQRSLVHVPDLAASDRFTRCQLLAEEGLASYVGAPLIAKGQIKGVIEIFHRSPLRMDADWKNFFETLAGQAAIAIDNASLFEELQRTNLDLSLAYDATIEGWSRALDLRDQETEGHTQRVVAMTLELARRMGVADEEMIHIRRGALLHDIGKMAIPDRILHKAGPLDEMEWELMRQHPRIAYEMLSPISYLRLAVNIPYCHHERWAGSGYPRGLKGEEIPLAARIFAVVDVWDAITSDRPYRKAWERSAAITYIKQHTGTHFDPQVVEEFLRILR